MTAATAPLFEQPPESTPPPFGPAPVLSRS